MTDFVDKINAAVLAERERCSNIAAQCARGIAIEVNGETHLLGVMMKDPASAQHATACAIMEAIDGTAHSSTKPDTPETKAAYDFIVGKSDEMVKFAGEPERSCTCHPDDNPPVPCARKYALTECRESAHSSTERGPSEIVEGKP